MCLRELLDRDLTSGVCGIFPGHKSHLSPTVYFQDLNKLALRLCPFNAYPFILKSGDNVFSLQLRSGCAVDTGSVYILLRLLQRMV